MSRYDGFEELTSGIEDASKAIADADYPQGSPEWELGFNLGVCCQFYRAKKQALLKNHLAELNSNNHEHNYELNSRYDGKNFYKCGTCGKMKEELIK
jgi:hypothetical protein